MLTDDVCQIAQEIVGFQPDALSQHSLQPGVYFLTMGKTQGWIAQVGDLQLVIIGLTVAIVEVVGWLEKAQGVAENDQQGKALGLLIEFYKSGDLNKWAEFNIAWSQATEGDIDYIQGFVEVYGDPKGMRGSYESIVQVTDFEASAQMKV